MDKLEKVENELKKFYKPFQDIGVTVKFVGDDYLPAESYCELLYNGKKIGTLNPDVECYTEEVNYWDDDEDPMGYNTETYYEYDNIDCFIKLYHDLDEDGIPTNYNRFYVSDIEFAVEEAKRFIVILKNFEVKKKLKNIKKDF